MFKRDQSVVAMLCTNRLPSFILLGLLLKKEKSAAKAVQQNSEFRIYIRDLNFAIFLFTTVSQTLRYDKCANHVLK